MVGVAVKVKDVPDAAGLVPVVRAIETAGATDGFTVIVMLLLLAVGEVAHAELDVIVQATTAPEVKVVVLNVAALVPAAEPFTDQA